MKIQLIDRNKEMCDEWSKLFTGIGYENIVIHNGDFFSLPADCIVSPANSFGFMDGGLDGVITQKIGNKTQEKLQKLIKENYHGELLVGQAVLIETEYQEIPYCISAPTMRVSLKISNLANVYLASKAAFRVMLSNPKIQTVTMSGLGTGVGAVLPHVCARQMKKAYDEVILGEKNNFNIFWDAQNEHNRLISQKI